MDSVSKGAGSSTAGKITETKKFAETIDTLATESLDPWILLQKFTASLREGHSGLEFQRTEVICALERALAYSIEDDPKYYGASTLGVQFSSALNDWPPAINLVSTEEKKIWQEAAAALEHPLPKAHFLDLVYSAGIEATPTAGTEVVALYLELATVSHLDEYYRASCLRRAWSISRRLSLPAEQDARQSLWGMCQSLSAREGTPAGVLLQPFAPLVVAPRTGAFESPSRAEVQERLESIRASRWPYAPIVEEVTGLLEKLAVSPTELEDARRKLVEAYFDLAELQPGIAASSWYDAAYKAAEKYGFVDLREQVVSARQEMPLSALEMRSHIIEAQLPRHLTDVHLSRYRHAGDSRVALDLWLTSSAPTGCYEDNLKSARESTSGGSIMQLVTRSTFNSDGLPVKTSTGAEDYEKEMLERLELMGIGIHGVSLARELYTIKTNYGVVTPAEIGAHLSLRYECDYELAEAFGEALNSFWEGRYSDAGRAAFPLVEAGARGLLLSLGDPLYRMPTETRDGRFPSLGEYSKRLEKHNFDMDWQRCLVNPVASLRNSLAHGHLHQLKNYEAATLLRMAGLLVILTPEKSSEVDRDEVARRLRDPIGWAAGKVQLTKRVKEVWVIDSLEIDQESSPS